MREDKLCLSIREVARLMGLSLPVVYRLARQKDFPKIIVGRRYIVPIDALKVWLEKNSHQPV